MKTYIGIDPGKTGAMAIIYNDRRVELFDFDQFEPMLISNLLSSDYSLFVAIERAQAMPKQGVVSMFHYGVNYGGWLMALRIYGISYQEIPPQTWKKEFSLGKDKDRSRELACQLFPSVSDSLKKKKDHGRAEALLLAEYARRKNM